jgi:16S rRNA pseudouridine516 synthase
MKSKNTKMRIDKFLSNQGIGSRKDVRRLIQKGFITVNGNQIRQIDMKIDAIDDDIHYDGQKVLFQSVVYLMLNKPKNCITATEDSRHRVVMDFIEHPLKDKLFPVGRLDIDTTGLLILTNDGQLAHDLLSPKKHVDKTYHASLDEPINDMIIDAFNMGVKLDDGYVTKPAKLVKIASREDSYNVEVTIQEGKFHQIKRMFSAFDIHVLELKRVKMGALQLDQDLGEGEFRELTREEYLDLSKK